ncbi:hypothetical protein N2152v2_009666 [Parachlorella kessleri]
MAAAAEQEAQPVPESKWVGTTKERGEQMVERAMKRNPMVRFMLEKLEEAGCSVGRSFFQVENCSVEVGGGFRPPDGIVICHNHLGSQTEIDQALTHELIHAYDHCRAKNMDWSDCRQHACSEIRAASLSGDCHFKMELMRGNLGVHQQHQKCVRRRAELSVSMNPYCKGAAGAKQAVDAVFAPCFADTAPFDRIP